MSEQPFYTTQLSGGPTGKPKEKLVLIDRRRRRREQQLPPRHEAVRNIR